MRGVAIIESPGLQDITSGFRSGAALAEFLRLLRVPFVYLPIHSKELLKPKLIQTAKDFDVVHLSAHGYRGALSFTDGSVLHGDEMQWLLLPSANGRIVSLDACGSSNFAPAESLASFMQDLTDGALHPPRCVMTMFGNVTFGDSALTWSLFYRQLECMLGKQSAAEACPRSIRNSLLPVRGANLHKICAAYWYERHKKYVNISPWSDEDGERVAAMERGESEVASNG